MATSSVQKKRSSQSSNYLSVISDAASSVGYSTLKNEQIRAIEGQVETEETENGNGKLKRKTEAESGNGKAEIW